MALLKERLATQIGIEAEKSRKPIGWGMDIDKVAKTCTIFNDMGFRETLSLSDSDVARAATELIEEYIDLIEDVETKRRLRALQL